MKKEILLWMAGLICIFSLFSLLHLPSVSAYPYQLNFCNMSINNSLQNYTGNISLLCSQGFSFIVIDFPSLSFNFTNSSNATYAIQLGIVLFNNTFYLIPSTNLTYGYNRTEMDNFFMSKADWANFNSITLKEYLTRQEYLNNTNNSQWLEQVNVTSQLRTDIDDQKSSMDTWKLIIIVTLIISIINLLWMIKVAFFS